MPEAALRRNLSARSLDRFGRKAAATICAILPHLAGCCPERSDRDNETLWSNEARLSGQIDQDIAPNDLRSSQTLRKAVECFVRPRSWK